MKYVISVLFLLLTVVSASAAENVVVYGDSSYPPYCYSEAGIPRGLYVDILKRAFSMMPEYEVTIKTAPWQRVLSLAESGRIMAFFAPYYRPEMRPWLSYSEPLHKEGMVVFCREEVMREPRPNWPQDYRGLKIGVNAGFAVGREEQAQGIVSLEEAHSNEISVLKLVNNHLDCYINDRLAVINTVKQLKREGRYDETANAGMVEGTVILEEPTYLAYSRNGSFPYLEDFKAKFDEVIRGMASSGELEAIISSYK